MMGAVTGTPPPPPAGGLCLACAQVRVVRSGRGSVFLMCERGLRKEAGFAKYPRLPVVACPGFVPSGTKDPDASAGDAETVDP